MFYISRNKHWSGFRVRVKLGYASCEQAQYFPDKNLQYAPSWLPTHTGQRLACLDVLGSLPQNPKEKGVQLFYRGSFSRLNLSQMQSEMTVTHKSIYRESDLNVGSTYIANGFTGPPHTSSNMKYPISLTCWSTYFFLCPSELNACQYWARRNQFRNPFYLFDSALLHWLDPQLPTCLQLGDHFCKWFPELLIFLVLKLPQFLTKVLLPSSLVKEKR